MLALSSTESETDIITFILIFHFNKINTRSTVNCLDLQNNKIDAFPPVAKALKDGEAKALKDGQPVSPCEDAENAGAAGSASAEEAAGEPRNLVDEVLAKMPELKVLYLKGNPCVKKLTGGKSYRKYTIARIGSLTYLDDRPVFKDDRRT